MIVSILIAGLLAAMAVALFMGLRNRGPSEQNMAQMSSGVITVTGVNDRPMYGDAAGQAYMTISGTIMGPDISPTEVYGSFTHSVAGEWLHIGQELPVRYDPHKVEQSWVLMPD